MARGGKKPPVQPMAGHEVAVARVSLSTERWVGRVAIEWSKLEATMDDLIWSFLDLPIEYGRIVTGRADANGKIQMLRALGRLVLPDGQRQAFSDILNSINDLREDRNMMVHGSWGVIEPRGDPVAASLKPKSDEPFTVVAEHFPQRRMRQIQDRILNAKRAIIHVREVIDRAREGSSAPSQEAQPSRPPNPGDQTP